MEYYRVGTIVNTQGLTGQVRVVIWTDFPEERFKEGASLALFDEEDKYLEKLIIKSGLPHKNFWLVKFKGLDHINQVEKYRGMSLKVGEDQLSSLPEGEFYYHQIIGLEVFEKGRLIGRIEEILKPGANDVWVVKRLGRHDLLLPYIPSVITKVNLLDKRVEVEIPSGLDDEVAGED